MKKFITTITLQSRGADKLCYADDTAEGKERILTAFPIIQKICDTAEEGERIKIVAMVVGDGKYRDNYNSFVSELDELKSRKGFEYELESIEKEENEHQDTVISFFGDIISKIEDGDSLYACITYGTKPMSIITTMALHYAYRIKKDISVEALIYGMRNWHEADKPLGIIYNTTSLFYIDCMIDRIANMGVSDPQSAVKALMDMIGD
ncbi:MAG: hypothetical protein E7647_02800 [Ruminococcaceae bacterium]|nr:hypothetical protein [Oscillospiraceae bacterium]